MLVTPLVLIQIFSQRMLVDWPKCGSDPQDEGHLACLVKQQVCAVVCDFSPLRLAMAWVKGVAQQLDSVGVPRDAKVGKHR